MPRIDVGLSYEDGRKQVVSVGRPADLIAFADTFEKLAPTEPHLIREAAWLAHHALGIEEPLDVWVRSLEDITTDEEQVAAIRAELEGADPGDAAAEAAPVTALSPVEHQASGRGMA